MLRLFLILLSLTMVASAWPALPLGPEEIEVGREFFGGRDTVVYVEDLESGRTYAVGTSRIDERHVPFSTFKVPNFLIALESGAVENSQSVLKYSAQRRPRQDFWPKDWAQDQTLHTAFQRSAVWAFQDIAVEVGDLTYQGYLKHFHYGNEMASGDKFWLAGPLEISVKEQVDFLRRLLTGQFEVSPLSIKALKQAALVKTEGGFSVYGKTGAGPLQAGRFDGEFQGWFVGWLERPNAKPVLFCLWTQGPSYASVKDYRLATCLQVLDQLAVLPLAW